VIQQPAALQMILWARNFLQVTPACRSEGWQGEPHLQGCACIPDLPEGCRLPSQLPLQLSCLLCLCRQLRQASMRQLKFPKHFAAGTASIRKQSSLR
jgi:hypothetical protein